MEGDKKITIGMRKEAQEEVKGKGIYNEQRQIISNNKE